MLWERLRACRERAESGERDEESVKARKKGKEDSSKLERAARAREVEGVSNASSMASMSRLAVLRSCRRHVIFCQQRASISTDSSATAQKLLSAADLHPGGFLLPSVPPLVGFFDLCA